jgi:hypothetical protein
MLVDPKAGKLTEFFLPSAGDTSYPGLVIFQDKLWIGYYSSLGSKTSICLATIPLVRLVQLKGSR